MLTEAPFPLEGRRTLLLADGMFSPIEAKTAVCYLMYRSGDVVAVLDRACAGRIAGEVAGVGGDTPVVGSVEDATALGAEVAIVGTAPMGGGLAGPLRDTLHACLAAGMDVVSGLHAFLGDDAWLVAAARRSGARTWDVRRTNGQQRVSTGIGCTTGARVVLLVGSDCNVGKMTATVELHRAAAAAGLRSSWAATGQTGIMLRGRGVAVDRVISDFAGGAAEELVNIEGRDADIVWVEGQGSIVHPGYAGVTLALMYGAMPDAMVLAYTADRSHFKRLEGLSMPPLPELIDLHEALMRPHGGSPVLAITVNTSMLTEADARRFLQQVQEDTGRPATDVVRFGCRSVLDAVTGYFQGES